MPKISVIMPAYNAEKYIAEAIDSILGQTFGDFEFIILNDCSKDRTEEIILSYDDPRIVYVKNEENMGVARTLNKGLELAKGEYIARMDADDISLPERFAKQVAFLTHNPKTVVCGSAITLFGQTQESQVRSFPTNPAQAQLQLIFAPCFAHPSVMIRRNILEEQSLRYDIRWEGTEDYAFWWDLGKHGDLCSLQECLLCYRIHPQQVTANSNPKIETTFIPFARKRLEDLDVNCTLTDAKILFAYTSGKLLLAQAEQFILLLEKISQSPKAKQRFQQRKLHQYLSTEIFSVIEGFSLSKREKQDMYKQAKLSGFNLKFLRIKHYCSQILRRIL